MRTIAPLAPTVDRPWVTGPGRSGSIRDADVVVRDGVWWIDHEVMRPDGAHELRLARSTT